MAHISKQKIEQWLGKRRMAQVGQLWFESDGFQIVLKDGLDNAKWDTNGRFVRTDEPISDIKEDLLEFFDDVVEVAAA